ncbi:RNA polymerase II transcription mediator [Actinidia rufa]|uniref:RNA polymerase II transcription mediator n=1 Tax=Actinidia rufa TaxID=165716 RepID=A0A7J0EWB1_9ERIC|nr:RNA polymerase II transcription mediator [Actinidia rufa]
MAEDREVKSNSYSLGYVFAVSVHRVQLLLQVLSVKRFCHSQQQQQQNSAIAQEELTQSEIGEICDYFRRRAARKVEIPARKPCIELCLENHAGSNIHYDRPHNSVDFALTVVLDPTHIPHINAAGGAAWLPYCASVRLRYSFGESPSVSFLGMEGSHRGRACWLRLDDWDMCKQRVARTVEVNAVSAGDINQGRLRIVADSVQSKGASFDSLKSYSDTSIVSLFFHLPMSVALIFFWYFVAGGTYGYRNGNNATNFMYDGVDIGPTGSIQLIAGVVVHCPKTALQAYPLGSKTWL